MEELKSKIIKIKKQAFNSEGSIFKIGDTVRKPKDKTILTILGFYYNDKKEVIVTTDRFKININYIEHYISKPEFIIPEKWFILRNKKNGDIINRYIGLKLPISIHPCLLCGYIAYSKKSWSSMCSETYFIRNGFIEITFEQFKQYVLFDGFEVGDKIRENFKIVKLEYINGCSVAFYKVISSGHTGPQCRILTKNI